MAEGSKIAEAYVEIGADGKPLEKGLAAAKSKVTGWISGLGSVAGKVGAVLGVAGLAASGLDGLKSAIMSASDLNETVSKTGVVFGAATSRVTAFADEMADKYGASRQSMLDAASALGLIGKAAGMSQADAAGMSVAMARLADDASSFYNVPLDEALDTIRSALVGEAEPIRKFGVLLNEDAVKAEAMRLGLVKAGAALTEQGKIIARVSLIKKGMADADGDHERTADSFANTLKEAWGRVKNTMQELGAIMMPFAEIALGVFDNITWAIEGVVSKLKQMLEYLGWILPAATAVAKETKKISGPTEAEKAKAFEEKAQSSVASDKESQVLKERVAAIQEEQRLEAAKERNRKMEIEVLKARRLDSWLITSKGADGKSREVVAESKRAEVDKIMEKYVTPDSLMSAAKDRIGKVLGAAAQLKGDAVAGLAIGANMLTAPARTATLTGVTDSESYRRSAQDSILNRTNDVQKNLLDETKKQTSELQAIKEGVVKQAKGLLTAAFG